MSALSAPAPATTLPFVPPANYLEFLAFDPRHIYKFLKSRKCPVELIEDFEQSLHTHLMSIGKTGKARGHVDKLAEYAPQLRGNATTVKAWADWLNMLLGREYGKLIKRNNRGGIRGPNVISMSVSPEAQDADFAAILEGDDRARMTDFSYQNMTAKVMASAFLDYLREEGGETVYTFAQNLMIYDSLTEVAREMGITTGKAARIRTQMQEIGERFKRGC